MVVISGVLFFALIWWWLGARKYYIGPRSNTEAMIARGDGEEAARAAKIEQEIRSSRHVKAT